MDVRNIWLMRSFNGKLRKRNLTLMSLKREKVFYMGDMRGLMSFQIQLVESGHPHRHRRQVGRP